MKIPSTLFSAGCAAMLFAALPLAAAVNDSDAGTWKMIVLTSPTQIAVPAPAPVTDPGYLAEVAAVKSAQANLTSAQRTEITYWGSGGVYRWNQILLGLVAASDLPPEPNADGTYTFPSAATPFAFPQYPFANPPYAARSYSYVAVAQFEALKAAWYYKYLYNRPTPSSVDPTVKALIGTNGLPAYPSEDAVVSGVTVALLQVLFPTQVNLINQQAAAQLEAAQLSGKAAASDIAAGLALGQAVAAVFTARASTDGLKAATGTAAQWQAFADAATAKGQIPWISQESPPRPPMLPFFGSVKTWILTPADIVHERPGPPPSTNSPEMAEQVAAVKSTLENLTRDQQAIATKWADGVSSPTPPGHWNFIAESYVTAANFTEVRAARAFALLDMALHDAAVACWDTKYTYFNPRPQQMDPSIKTVIGLPNFPSYESGHSTFSGAADQILSYLFPAGKSYFDASAQEAAISRLYGGIHYPIDNDAGLAHGSRIGAYTVRFAQQDGADQGTISTSTAGQVLDGASFHAPVVAGSLAAVFEPNLASGLTVANTVPLPDSLGGVSLSFYGSLAAPIFGVSASQANIQIPWELQGLSTANLTTTSASGATATFAVPLAAFAPAIFSVNQQGTGQGLVVEAASGALVAAPGSIAGATTTAASKGDYITIYCVGLGPVNNQPASGSPALDATSTTTSAVTVSFNGVTTPASFSGLAPGALGIYQVNVQVPSGAPTGSAVPLTVTVGSATSNTVTIALQ
jgi:uncharacterized protein (TIGR03437 family)